MRILLCIESTVKSWIGRVEGRGVLIIVEQVLVVLTECVTSFSELEEILDTLKVETNVSLLDRIKWASKESAIVAVCKRLESNKVSLTLMLTILQSLVDKLLLYC